MTTAVKLTKNQRTGAHQLERNITSDYVRCFRCKGFMVAEQGFDSMFGNSEADVSLRRCVQCGEVIDPLILQNRRLQRRSELERAQK